MENICSQLLERCLLGETWTRDEMASALALDGGRVFLSTVVERLGDLFEPELSNTYSTLFTQVIHSVAPELVSRIHKAAPTSVAPTETMRVYVLSRVTLGADVAVTSVLMDAAKKKYPHAQVFFVGPRRSYELFETDSRISHLAAPYARSGTLAERLKASADLWLSDGIVIDPDSRLTQLGLISVCDENRYFCFPSRSYGGTGNDSLPTLAARWAQEVFGTANAQPWVAPRRSNNAAAEIAVSLGVGENPAKRCDDAFEKQLLHLLADTGASIVIDEGGDAEERARVQRALIPGMRTHSGSFASFASLISQSRLYVGYDSAGGHVASACGVPLISIAKGFVNKRMAARWRPNGVIIDGDDADALLHIHSAIHV